ncbi:short-chain dehydrogenase [Marasmius fiardii PR-910]|nr:short-chain dehydrogenase [Marasmius fiardii PR-910]
MPPPVEGVSLEGQVVLITGANTGIGYEAAKHFAKRGPEKLIIVVRNEEKGRKACDRLKSETDFQNIELWIVDLGSFESIKGIKGKIDQLERLDILVENAAALFTTYNETEDGWESTLQVNVLANALHLILHIPKMLDTAKKYPRVTPRIVSVSSDIHYYGTVPTEAIDASNTLKFVNREEYARKSIDSQQRYTETKILLLMFMRALQSRLPISKPTITCCSINPGFCYSELRREITGETAEFYRKMEEEIGLTSEEGSRVILYGAIGERDKEEELRAVYLSFCRVSECSDFVLSAEGQRLEKKLWNEIVDVVGKVDGKAKDIITEYLF